MAKLSNAAAELLLIIDSPDVNVSFSAGPRGYDTMFATPKRGHGTTSNPRASVGVKLLRDGLITDAGTFLALTPAGREESVRLHAEGWEVITQVGRKPSARIKSV